MKSAFCHKQYEGPLPPLPRDRGFKVALYFVAFCVLGLMAYAGVWLPAQYPFRAIVTTADGQMHELPSSIEFGSLHFEQTKIGGRAYTVVTVRDGSGSITGYFSFDSNKLDLIAVPQ
jgi:hypothetical protein